MAIVLVKQDPASVAAAASEIACTSLTNAIAAYGQAVWVLAGGTAPVSAYQLMAKNYADKLDWGLISAALGDERCVPVGHADSNWLQISAELLDHLAIPEANKLHPTLGLVAEKAATLYETMLLQLPQKEPGIPRLNHVWLGMGQDGHTLSLFPDHPSLDPATDLVIPVHNSPKPPPDRISLTMRALAGTESCLVMAVGAGKAAIAARALRDDTNLPIVQAVKTIESAGGKVTWLLDTAAASLITDPGSPANF